MITTVYLIRHGQTVDSEEKKYKGHIDVPLSKEGRGQAERLARYMSVLLANGSERPVLNAVYSSGLSRAIDTARIISRPFDIEPEEIEGLKERSFGKWEGMTFSEIQQEYPSEFSAWVSDPLSFSPVNGESTQDVNNRVMPVYSDILARHEGDNIAIIAHGGVNRIILCNILGIPLELIFRVEQDFSGLNVIRYYEGTPVVKTFNSTAHLNGPGPT
ncbi:MAG: alpha-ribazole phosphatase [Nitrospirota bacterium]|nr:MAG: alpha-ribazole phosphatase [Nitrospirota bacterium]